MDDRLARARRAFKAAPCPESAFRWASLECRIHPDILSGKKVSDLAPYMQNCYGRLIKVVKEFGLDENSPVEKMLALEMHDFTFFKGFGSISLKMLINGLITLKIGVPDTWIKFLKIYHFWVWNSYKDRF